MARTKQLKRELNQLEWLTKQEAMTWVNVSEEIFNAQWRPFLNMYDNGGKGPMFSKRQIDDFMAHRLAIKGNPFEYWHH